VCDQDAADAERRSRLLRVRSNSSGSVRSRREGRTRNFAAPGPPRRKAGLAPAPPREHFERIVGAFSQSALFLCAPALHLRFPTDSVSDGCERFRVNQFDRAPSACIPGPRPELWSATHAYVSWWYARRSTCRRRSGECRGRPASDRPSTRPAGSLGTPLDSARAASRRAGSARLRSRGLPRARPRRGRVEWWRRRELHPGPKIHPRRNLRCVSASAVSPPT
jgi:hypothetical protein